MLMQAWGDACAVLQARTELLAGNRGADAGVDYVGKATRVLLCAAGEDGGIFSIYRVPWWKKP
jgi:hypothetical protein